MSDEQIWKLIHPSLKQKSDKQKTLYHQLKCMMPLYHFHPE